MGEKLALEAATYVTIHKDFTRALIELGFQKGKEFKRVCFQPVEDTGLKNAPTKESNPDSSQE